MLVAIQYHYILGAELETDNRAILLGPVVEPGRGKQGRTSLDSATHFRKLFDSGS